MKYRNLGKTGIRVSEIGAGTWAIGGDMWGPQDEKDSIDALNRALDLGCNFIDTALAYGEGNSERIVGRALKERKLLEDVVVATKVPPKNYLWSPPAQQPIKEAFPPDWIVKCCETSLKNLGREYLDLLQLHTWDKSWDKETEWFDELCKLKDQGKIRAFGISASGTRHNEANSHVEKGRVDTIQVVYNMLDQSAEKELLPLAKKTGTGIIARVPLAEGGLTGKFNKDTKFHPKDWRKTNRDREWFKKLVEQSGIVKKSVGGIPLHEAAIKFCLSNPAVSTTIPGVRNARQAEMNFGISEKGLDTKTLENIRNLWSSGKIGGLNFA